MIRFLPCRLVGIAVSQMAIGCHLTGCPLYYKRLHSETATARKMCSAVEEGKHNVQTPSIHIASQPSLNLLTTQIITNPTTTITNFQGTSSFMKHTSMQWMSMDASCAWSECRLPNLSHWLNENVTVRKGNQNSTELNSEEDFQEDAKLSVANSALPPLIRPIFHKSLRLK